MSSVAIVIIFFGILITVSRGPLVVAPEATRDFYLRLMATDGGMRLIGGVVLALGWLIAITFAGAAGSLAHFLWYAGLVLVGVTAVYILPFAGHARRMGTRVWSGFSEGVLRGIGAISLAFGLGLIVFGFTL